MSRRWINNTTISLLALNCWSTPILKRWLHVKPALECLSCLVLDIGANHPLLLAIFLHYYEVFDMVTYSFPDSLLYDQLWFTRLTMGNRMVFAPLLVNLLSKAFNYLSILKTNVNISNMIERRHGVIMHNISGMANREPATEKPKKPTRFVSVRHCIHKIVHPLFVLW